MNKVVKVEQIVEAAKVRHDQAVQAFEIACEQALQASIRAAGLAVALAKGILRRDDTVARQIEWDLSRCGAVVRSTRQDRDAAQQALDQAGRPTLWERQRLLVGRHAPDLLAKYDEAYAKAAAADDEAVKSRWEQALAKLGHDITRFRVPEDVSV